MGALKSACIGAAAALLVLGAGYTGGCYARVELNRRLTARLAHYGAGLHAEAAWAHPARGGAWVVEGLRVWDEGGMLEARIREARLVEEELLLRDVELQLHGSATDLRKKLRAEHTNYSETSESGSRGRTLTVENASLRWDIPAGASWSVQHAHLQLRRDEQGLHGTIDQSEAMAGVFEWPSGQAQTASFRGHLLQFPYALLGELGPSLPKLSLASVTLSLDGQLEVERGSASASEFIAGIQSARWDGRLSVTGLGLQDSHLSAQALEGLAFTLDAEASLTPQRLDLARADLVLGALRLSALGRLELSNAETHRPELTLDLKVPKVSCDALRTAVPPGMWTHLYGAELGGSFDFHGHLNTTGTDDEARLHFETHADCTFLKVPESANPERFKAPFSYTVLDQTGAPRERRTGPGTESWTPLDEIPDAMRAALLTSEDAGFYEHHGISLAAIRRAALKDMAERAFVQGASTLSMQLAKNVYLARNKTLARKAEELLLTTLLEHGMQKDELLELYLNVVEFGPDTYGIRDAAMHYFGRAPRELSVAECFFLVSGLPAPKRLEAAREKGTLPDKLKAHLGFLLRTAQKRGHIESEDLARASRETLVFWRPGMPPPEPHDAWAEDPASTGGIEAGQETGSYP